MKKQILSFIAFLSVIAPLSSCSNNKNPGTGGNTGGGGIVNTTTTPDIPVIDVTDPFFSDILRKGFAVSSTVPAIKSNLTQEQLNAFLDRVFTHFHVENIGYPRLPFDFFSSEKSLEALKTGGVTQELLSGIEDILTTTPFIESIQKIDQERYEEGEISKETVLEAVQCFTPFLKLGTQDQFAAITSILLEFFLAPYTAFQDSYNAFTFGMYGLYSIALNVLPLMTGKVQAFFQNFFEDSNIDTNNLSFASTAYACFATPELSFFVGRFAYQLLNSALSNLGEENLAELIQLSLNWFANFDAFDSEQSAHLGNLYGRVLEDCFMDYSSFQNFVRLFATSLSNMPKKIETDFFSYIPGQFLAYTEDYKAAVDKMSKDGKGYFATIKFVANVMKNMDARDYDAAYHFFETMFRTYDYENMDFSTDIIRFSKVITEAFTRFPLDKNAIIDGIARSGDLFMSVMPFALSFDVSSSYVSGSFGKFYFPPLDTDALMELLQESATLDPDNASQEERDKINNVVMEIAKDMEENYSQTFYSLSGKACYRVGEKPSFQIQSSDSSLLIDIPESDIQGFDSSSPRSGIATFVYDDITFVYSYLVSNSSDIIQAYCVGDIWSGKVALGTPREEMPDVYCRKAYGPAELVDKNTIIDYEASTVGIHYAYIPVGEEYVIFSYEVYDPDTTSLVFDFGTHYKGEYESQNFRCSIAYKKDGEPEQQLTNSSSITTCLDFSSPGKKEKRMRLQIDGRLIENAIARYEVEDTVSASTYVYCEVDYSVEEFYQGTNEYLNIKDREYSVSRSNLQSNFTLPDGTKISVSYNSLYDSPDNIYYDSSQLTALHFENEAFDTTTPGSKMAFAQEKIDVSIVDSLGTKVDAQTMPVAMDYEVIAGSFDYEYSFDEAEYVFNRDGNSDSYYAEATIAVTFASDSGYDNVSDNFYRDFRLNEISQNADFDLTPGSHSYTVYAEWERYGNTYRLPLTLRYIVNE